MSNKKELEEDLERTEFTIKSLEIMKHRYPEMNLSRQINRLEKLERKYELELGTYQKN